ncbi:MAG: basic amino acid/polyamine antiporter, family [Aliidongia sp.]|jgi:APA family basic amino acid/polyamine antiporter|nr:basic amino acid/polyamine antiporter, family [Aliidongia sp.]
MNETNAALAAGGPQQPAMKRVLGAWHLTAIGIGAIIGAGLFSLTGLAAGEHAGPAVILAYVIAAIPAGLTGLCYAELAAMFPQSGSCYTYARNTAGDLLAWIVGWDLILEFAVAGATVAASFSGYFNSLLMDYGLELPYWLLNGPFGDGAGGVPGIVNLPAVLLITACSLVLLRGISESAWVNSIIVVVKLAVIIGLIALGLGSIKTANYLPFIPANTGNFGEFGWSGIFRAAAIIFFAYIGFETVSTAAQEAKNPQRDMPIGMLGSLVICALLYVAFAAILVGLVPYESLKGDASPAQTALAATPYPWARTIVAIGIMAGYATSILTALYGQSRIFAVMASDGMLPSIFATIHARWRTPWISVLLFLVFTGTLAGLVPLEDLGDVTSIGTLLAFAVVALCVLVLRRTQPDLPRPFRVPFMPWLPLVTIAMCIVLMASLDFAAWKRLILWLVVGLAIRAAMSLRSRPR